MWTWIDVLTLALSVIALIVSLWTRYQDRQWKAEVEGRRPFAENLQRLSLMSAQHKLSAIRCVSLFKQLHRKVNALEQQFGPRSGLDSLRHALREHEAALEEDRRSLAETQQFISHLWKVSCPSSDDFARVQQMQSQLAIALSAVHMHEENLREQLDNLGSVQ